MSFLIVVNDKCDAISFQIGICADNTNIYFCLTGNYVQFDKIKLTDDSKTELHTVDNLVKKWFT